jgi:2-keto-4-pentenoate hydratase/2-oxohepta-3-ene-1,7-dioic acid hydratase in catechol pathway
VRPQENAAGADGNPLIPTLATPGAAFTFAQTRAEDGKVSTLIVASFDEETIQAVDLTTLGAPPDVDVFDAIATIADVRLQEALAQPALRSAYPIADLLPAAGSADRHLATGTNFPEHAKEAAIDKVFNFPKFGAASPARTSVELWPEGLLDYEVEICTRFDRDIKSVADFDAARKGFFLCGDFSERATLMRLVNPDDVGSGQGFSDAKSAAGFFPTGPFLIVPRDWWAFVKSERIGTRVNGQVRQDAQGEEMTLDFRELVEKALTGGGGRYVYRGAAVPLLVDETIPRGSTVMSGTSEGVIFKPPTVSDFIVGTMIHVFTGPMLRGGSLIKTVVEVFIRKERHARRYLQESDVVEHLSSSMGDIRIRVVPPAVMTPIELGRRFQRDVGYCSAISHPQNVIGS